MSSNARLLKSTALVLIISNFNNFLNYLIQILLGRYLSPESYGAFNSVNSLGTIASFGTQVLSIVMAKYTPIHGVERERMTQWVGQWRRLVVVAGLVMTAGMIGLSGVFGSFLNLSDRTPQILFFVGIFFFHLFVMYNSIVNGFGSYLSGTCLLMSHTALRVGLTWLFVVPLGQDYNGPFWATLIASVVVMVVQVLIVQRKIAALPAGAESLSAGIVAQGADAGQSTWKDMDSYRFLVPTTISLIVVAVMTNVDILFVKHYSTSAEAGFYSMAAIVARIGFFLPHTLAFLILPEISRNSIANRSSLRTILQLAGISAAIACGYATVVSLFPGFVLNVLYGAAGAAAVSYVAPVAWATAVIAVCNMMFNVMLGKSMYRYLFGAVAGAVLTVGAMAWGFHDSPQQVAMTLFWGAGATLVLSMTPVLIAAISRRPEQSLR